MKTVVINFTPETDAARSYLSALADAVRQLPSEAEATARVVGNTVVYQRAYTTEEKFQILWNLVANNPTATGAALMQLYMDDVA